MQGILNTPSVWWNAFLQNPGPWLLIAAMVAGVLVLRAVVNTTPRRRRVTRR